ncbi:MAG: hypothetical protein AMXMBFR33_70210 [Candidatus Xenobia bacterium]
MSSDGWEALRELAAEGAGKVLGCLASIVLWVCILYVGACYFHGVRAFWFEGKATVNPYLLVLARAVPPALIGVIHWISKRLDAAENN